eukprot:208590_1
MANICDFWVCVCCRYKYLRTQYESRMIWISGGFSGDCQSIRTGQCNLFGYLMTCLLHYGVYVILIWIIVILYGSSDSDFVVKWHEFYPILILLLIKIASQIAYTFGPQYK